MSSSSKRHFTVVVGSKEHGLYVSSSPSSAARKIVSKLCASSKSKKVEFHVREITNGSKKKTYGPYLGEMKKLAKPIELKGRIIRYAPEVHLKKKSSITKKLVVKTKKMLGGEQSIKILQKKEVLDFYRGSVRDTRERRISGTPIYIDLPVETAIIIKDGVNHDSTMHTPCIFFGYIVKYSYNREDKEFYYKYLIYFYDNRVHIFELELFMRNNRIKNITIDLISNIKDLQDLNKFIETEQTKRNNSSFCEDIYKIVSDEISRR